MAEGKFWNVPVREATSGDLCHTMTVKFERAAQASFAFWSRLPKLTRHIMDSTFRQTVLSQARGHGT